MMFTQMFDIEFVQHLHHSYHFSLKLQHLGKICFDIHILAETIWQFDMFCLGFLSETSIEVPIATCYEYEIVFGEYFLRIYPFIKILKNIFNRFSFVYLLLCDSCEFCTKFRKFWIQFWLDVLMKDIELFGRMSVYQDDWKLYNLSTRFHLSIIDASSFEIQDHQIFYLRLQVVSLHWISDSIDLFFEISSSMINNQGPAYLAYVSHIIYSTMMFSFMLYSQVLKHVHHSCCALQSQNFGKVFFDIYVASQIFSDVKSFLLSFMFETTSQIPVSTSNKSKVSFLQIIQLANPSIELFQHLLYHKSLINHSLSDTCKFCAKIAQFWTQDRFNIMVKHIQMLSCCELDDDNRKFYDLCAWLYFLIFYACSLKIQYKEILQLCFGFVCLHLFLIIYQSKNQDIILSTTPYDSDHEKVK